MIRRLQAGAVVEVATRLVVGGHPPSTESIDGVVAEEMVAAEAYRNGYAEGFEAGQSDGLREATQRMQALEDAARDRLQELADERTRLATFAAGMATAFDEHGKTVEELAFEVALASLSKAFGELQGDGQLLQRLCAQMVAEFRVNAVHIEVSTQDRAALPEQVGGLEVVVAPDVAPGECRVVTGRGHLESSLGMRLDAIYAAVLEAVGIVRS